MKKILIISALAAFAAIAFSASQAPAASRNHAAAPKTLVVAMHDPGCHWFQIHGKFTKTAVESGAVRLVNYDEATLKVASSHGLQRIAVGKSLVLRHGKYAVTMVHQAADDNHLKLTVR